MLLHLLDLAPQLLLFSPPSSCLHPYTQVSPGKYTHTCAWSARSHPFLFLSLPNAWYRWFTPEYSIFSPYTFSSHPAQSNFCPSSSFSDTSPCVCLGVTWHSRNRRSVPSLLMSHYPALLFSVSDQSLWGRIANYYKPRSLGRGKRCHRSHVPTCLYETKTFGDRTFWDIYHLLFIIYYLWDIYLSFISQCGSKIGEIFCLMKATVSIFFFKF